MTLPLRRVEFLCLGEPLFRSIIWILGLLCGFVSSVRNPTSIATGCSLLRGALLRPAAQQAAAGCKHPRMRTALQAIAHLYGRFGPLFDACRDCSVLVAKVHPLSLHLINFDFQSFSEFQWIFPPPIRLVPNAEFKRQTVLDFQCQHIR
jgi:hypothetical protein